MLRRQGLLASCELGARIPPVWEQPTKTAIASCGRLSVVEPDKEIDFGAVEVVDQPDRQVAGLETLADIES